MKLYLLRHGSAVDVGERNVRSDAARMLTREGRERTATMLHALRNVCNPKGVWTSPLVRARETAEIARDELGVSAPVTVLEFLQPGADATAVAHWLATRREDALMLVGHMPDLSLLASLLTAGIKAEGLAIKKSGVCCIEFDADVSVGGGSLAWLVAPSLLSRLA